MIANKVIGYSLIWLGIILAVWLFVGFIYELYYTNVALRATWVPSVNTTFSDRLRLVFVNPYKWMRLDHIHHILREPTGWVKYGIEWEASHK